MKSKSKLTSVYKPKLRNRKSDPFLIAYTDPSTGKRRTMSGSTSRIVTDRKADELSFTLQSIKLGVIDPNADKFARAATRPLTEHIDDYGKNITDRSKTAQHAAETKALCRRVFDVAGAGFIRDISESGIQVAIKSLSRARKGKEATVSLRTMDKAVRAVKAFCHWMKRDKRTPVHLLADLTHYDPKQDRRRQRRILDNATLLHFVETTAASSFRGGMTGVDRAMMYELAIGTGFRLKTLRALKPKDFDFAGDPAIITVLASNTKGRKEYEHPIRADLAEKIKAHIADRTDERPIFSPTKRFSEAFQADCREADIPAQDASGRVFDFHAFRYQFITAVVRASGLAVGQDLAHHSTPTLTKEYAQLTMDDYGKALDALPELSRQANKQGRKTG